MHSSTRTIDLYISDNSYTDYTFSIDIIYNISDRGYILITKKELDVLKLRQKGMKQTDVAKKLGITQAAVSKFESNALSKIIRAKKLVELADEMGLEVQDEI